MGATAAAKGTKKSAVRFASDNKMQQVEVSAHAPHAQLVNQSASSGATPNHGVRYSMLNAQNPRIKSNNCNSGPHCLAQFCNSAATTKTQHPVSWQRFQPHAGQQCDITHIDTNKALHPSFSWSCQLASWFSSYVIEIGRGPK